MSAPAYRHNDAPVARERFYAIACDPRRSVAVEACAGAGKTWMLVSRIVRALLDGAKPQEILAITFTRKAAGEMRQRLYEWLAKWSRAPLEQLREELAIRGMPDADEATCLRLRNLHAELLASGRPVQVRTFHSWFAALLGAAPMSLLEDMDLPARYELLMDDSEAVARVWRRFHITVSRDPAARADYEASVATYGRFQTLKALGAALAKRIEFALADAHGVVADSVKPFAQQFPRFAGMRDPAEALARPDIRAALLRGAGVLGQARARTYKEKGRELEMAVTSGDLPGVLASLLTADESPRKFNDDMPGIADVRAAQDVALELLDVRCQHEAWLHHGRMTRLVRVLLREFAALKREQGWIDMNDVELAALRMLGDPVLSGFVQERLDSQVRHLLIDEFQDTNPLQWQALGEWLRSYAGAGSGAPGVFIVGDPKQSIYRFRRAEPRVFHAAQQFIVEGLGGDRLSSDHTRRNSRAVLAAVNQVFGAAQQAHDFEGFRPHTSESDAPGNTAALPQVPRPPRAQKEEAVQLPWRDSLTEPREVPEERLITLESRQAANWIAARIAAGTPPGAIMVLARQRDRLAEIDTQLRELHIPAQQPEKTDLGEQPEVQDVIALLDVLVTASHDLSLARALKSPLFGVGDEQLVELALLARAAKPAPSWLELLRTGEGLSQPLLEVREKLAKWKGLVDRLPPHDALEAIYQEGEVLARYAAATPAPLRASVLANLRALLGASLEVQGGRYLTPYAFVRALKNTKIPGPAVAADDVVRLLTIHGAKGLEAPIVLVLDSDGPPPQAETMGVLCEWPGEAPCPWRFAFIAGESRPPPCNADALRDELLARSREELNMLYVAMTRAQDALVMSSIEPHRRADTRTWWERVQPLCTQLEAPAPASPAAATMQAPFALPVLPRVEMPVTEALVRPEDSEVALFGSAVHRLLEFAAQAGGFPPARLRRVAREFSLSPAQVQRAATMARRILEGEGAWTWDARQVDWQGNEVELFHQGELLRMDRLVRHAASGAWWVLDYKSAHAPQDDPVLVAQMQRYRAAVAAVHPGAAVRTAFLTGEGRFIELA